MSLLVLFWLPRRDFEGMVSLLLSHVLMMGYIFFTHLFLHVSSNSIVRLLVAYLMLLVVELLGCWLRLFSNPRHRASSKVISPTSPDVSLLSC